MIVRFLRKHNAYNGGERAGFPPEEARQLIVVGIAEPAEPTPEPEQAPEPAPEQTQVPAVGRGIPTPCAVCGELCPSKKAAKQHCA